MQSVRAKCRSNPEVALWPLSLGDLLANQLAGSVRHFWNLTLKRDVLKTTFFYRRWDKIAKTNAVYKTRPQTKEPGDKKTASCVHVNRKGSAVVKLFQKSPLSAAWKSVSVWTQVWTATEPLWPSVWRAFNSWLCLLNSACGLHSEDNTAVRHKAQTYSGQISSPRHLTDI